MRGSTRTGTEAVEPFDEYFVTRFQQQFAKVLEIAGQVDAAHPASELTLLINHDGTLRIVQGSDWPLASLQDLHGAVAAYRVSRCATGEMQVTAREGGRTYTRTKTG